MAVLNEKKASVEEEIVRESAGNKCGLFAWVLGGFCVVVVSMIMFEVGNPTIFKKQLCENDASLEMQMTCVTKSFGVYRIERLDIDLKTIMKETGGFEGVSKFLLETMDKEKAVEVFIFTKENSAVFDQIEEEDLDEEELRRVKSEKSLLYKSHSEVYSEDLSFENYSHEKLSSSEEIKNVLSNYFYQQIRKGCIIR
jgi:hypothetical protein